MEEMKEEIPNKDDNTQTNVDDLPEPEISENELKDIIDFINNWDYEKYERDSEVREALLLLRNKMKKEEEEKAQKLNELRLKEKNENIQKENKDINIIEEDKNEKDIFISDQLDNNKINNVIHEELSEKEKEMLEKNWNSSTKLEYGEKIVNEKGDKEIIINNNENQSKKVIYIHIMILL